MCMEVDKARTDHLAARIDGPRRLYLRNIAAQDAHRLTLDPDRAIEADIAAAVDDLAATDEQIEHAFLLNGVRCRRSKAPS